MLEIFGVVFGFLYLFLEFRKSNLMWVVGLGMALVYAIVYCQQGIYAYMCFQIYYILVSVYGFLQWGKDRLIHKNASLAPQASGTIDSSTVPDNSTLGATDSNSALRAIANSSALCATANSSDLCATASSSASQETSQITYRKVSLKVFIWSAIIYAASTAFMVYVLGSYTDDSMPWADSSVTVLSAIATFWLSKSYREQWLMWLVVNMLTVIISCNLALYPTAVLYSVNTIASVWGYFYWKKKGIPVK